MVILSPVTVALWCGLAPEVEAMKRVAVPGEMMIPDAKHARDGTKAAASGTWANSGFRWSMDWLENSYEDLMSWEHNPWKRKPDEFGHHFFNLLASKDPKDIARVKELRRLAEAWHKRLLERYPEMAVEMRNVPDERNGFLKLLEFGERMEDGKTKGSVKIPFPAELETYLSDGTWNGDAARKWLMENKALMDEIRAIGLMPEQSVNGISVDRWGFTSARLVRGMVDALMIEARLAAETGDVAGAMEAVQAAKGMSSHVGNVENTSLLAATVQILVDLSLEKRVLGDILTALPPGQVDAGAWEQLVNPKVVAPEEFARLLKGEWTVGMQYYLLPMLLNTEDPELPGDGAELLDTYTRWYLGNIRAHETADVRDLPRLAWESPVSTEHLSRSSRDVTSTLFIGANSWRKGWERAQSIHAMNQAAFAILKGQPVPKDPVYGESYRWDPQTRVLSPPDTEAFREMKIDPVKVPGW